MTLKINWKYQKSEASPFRTINEMRYGFTFFCVLSNKHDYHGTILKYCFNNLFPALEYKMKNNLYKPIDQSLFQSKNNEEKLFRIPSRTKFISTVG